MSRSTTATTTHILLKYSRSYPPGLDQGATQGLNGEWEHFINPVMRLVLDVKKSANGDLESVRLRILWAMNAGGDVIGAGQEVVFEDLDLLSFSTPASQSSQTVTRNQGLPLKAVYRDAIVGIRYLWPSGNANSPGTYRRFQITFQSNVAASQFIDAVRYVCPCKTNPNPVAPRVGTVIPAKPQVPVVPLQANLSATANSGAYSQVYRAPIPVTPVVSKPTTSIATSSSQIVASFSNLPNFDLTDSSRPTTSSSSVLLPAGLKRAWNTDLPLATERTEIRPTPRPIDTSNVSNPSASLLNGGDCNMMPPPHVLSSDLNSQIAPGYRSTPEPVAQRADSHEVVMALLRESPTLYDLSRTELERLVSEVVREDGFLKLLENLDGMWKVKGFLAG